MLAAPTARPVTSRPTYITGRFPRLTACITVPTRAMTAAANSAARRPYLSATQYAQRAPTTAPAWRVDTMFASREAAALGSLSRALSIPNFL